MKIFWGRLKTEWVYPLGMILMVGFSLLLVNAGGTVKNEPANQSVKKAVENRSNVSANQPVQSQPAKADSRQAVKTNNSDIAATVKDTSQAQNGNTEVNIVNTSAQNTPSSVQTKPAETVQMSISGLGDFTVPISDGENAFDALKEAANENGFKIEYKTYSWGVMITKIGSQDMQGSYYWALYYNGSYAQVGASDLTVKNNDKIKWSYESWM